MGKGGCFSKWLLQLNKYALLVYLYSATKCTFDWIIYWTMREQSICLGECWIMEYIPFCCFRAIYQAWQCSGSPYWAGGGREGWPPVQESCHPTAEGAVWNAAKPDPWSPPCRDWWTRMIANYWCNLTSLWYSCCTAIHLKSIFSEKKKHWTCTVISSDRRIHCYFFHIKTSTTASKDHAHYFPRGRTWDLQDSFMAVQLHNECNTQTNNQRKL